MSGSRFPSPGQGALVLPTPEENQNEFADHYDHVDVYDRDDAVDGEVYQVRSVRSGPLLLLGPCVPASQPFKTLHLTIIPNLHSPIFS